MRRLLLAVMAVALMAVCASADTRKVRKMVVYSDNEVKYSGNTAEVDSVKFLLVDENFYNVTVLSGNGTMGSVAGGGEYIEGESATIVATANEGYEFDGWSDGNTDNPRTVVVTADMAFVANFREAVAGVGVENGHAWVDLGLPSGLLWATCNVGAENPEDYGNYYAWGETTTKSNYSWSTYKYGSNYDALTKYNTDSYYGTVDNKTVLDLADDAAHVNWGGAWRMPTEEEIGELVNNCTTEWTSINGVYGRKVTSNINNNYIFLPAAGDRLDSSLNDDGSLGYYWSSSLLSDYPYYAWYLRFSSSDFDRGNYFRYYGQSVRAVCPAGSN